MAKYTLEEEDFMKRYENEDFNESDSAEYLVRSVMYHGLKEELVDDIMKKVKELM